MSETKKILLIDDDADLVGINKEVLESKSYQVMVAYTGPTGIEKAETEKPDLIVLDVMMGTASEGFDTARALRQSETLKTIPIILLTSVNETVPFRFESDDTHLPVNRFLDKPVEPTKLAEEIEAVLKEATS